MKTAERAESSNWPAGAFCIRAGTIAGPVAMCGMFPTAPSPNAPPPGTWPLFKFRGIHVFLHWSWLLMAFYQISYSRGAYPHIGWDIAQYLTLFGIVTLHEFGHAFAARQVGGTAERILLWPFGGIAYVQTPQRPGAYLWSIAAGPLVNVALWPVFYFLAAAYCDPLALRNAEILLNGGGIEPLGRFLYSIFFLNFVMLVFNLLPVFPMDGGQILRGLLWFFVGPMKSLLVAAWTGLILGGAIVLYVAIVWENWLLAVIIALMVHQSWTAIQNVRDWRRQMAGQ